MNRKYIAALAASAASIWWLGLAETAIIAIIVAVIWFGVKVSASNRRRQNIESRRKAMDHRRDSELDEKFFITEDHVREYATNLEIVAQELPAVNERRQALGLRPWEDYKDMVRLMDSGLQGFRDDNTPEALAAEKKKQDDLATQKAAAATALAAYREHLLHQGANATLEYRGYVEYIEMSGCCLAFRKKIRAAETRTTYAEARADAVALVKDLEYEVGVDVVFGGP